MKLISKLLKSSDFCGNTITLEHKNKQAFKTIQGGIFSLIIVIVSLVCFYIFGKEVYQRKKPNINSSKTKLDTSDVVLDYNPFLFSLMLNNSSVTNINQYISITSHLQYVNFNGDISYIDDYISIKECNVSSFEYYKKNLSFDRTYYCPEFNKTTVSNELNDLNSSSLVFEITKCSMETEKSKRNINTNIDSNVDCASDIANQFNNLQLYLTLVNSYLNALDNSIPIQYKEYTQIISLSNSLHKDLEIELSNNTFTSDEGWLFENLHTYYYFKYEKIKIQSSISSAYDNNKVTIALSSLTTVSITKRDYTKLTDLLAKLGGIINVLYLSVGFLSSGIVRFEYLKYVFLTLCQIQDSGVGVIYSNYREYESFKLNNSNFNINSNTDYQGSKFNNNCRLGGIRENLESDNRILINNSYFNNESSLNITSKNIHKAKTSNNNLLKVVRFNPVMNKELISRNDLFNNNNDNKLNNNLFISAKVINSNNNNNNNFNKFSNNNIPVVKSNTADNYKYNSNNLSNSMKRSSFNNKKNEDVYNSNNSQSFISNKSDISKNNNLGNISNICNSNNEVYLYNDHRNVDTVNKVDSKSKNNGNSRVVSRKSTSKEGNLNNANNANTNNNNNFKYSYFRKSFEHQTSFNNQNIKNNIIDNDNKINNTSNKKNTAKINILDNNFYSDIENISYSIKEISYFSYFINTLLCNKSKNKLIKKSLDIAGNSLDLKRFLYFIIESFEKNNQSNVKIKDFISEFDEKILL